MDNEKKLENQAGVRGLSSIFPVPDIRKTTEYYVNKLGFRAVEYLECKEPHVCLYLDKAEIILLKANTDRVLPNRQLYGYGYDAYLYTDDQEKLEKEFLARGVKIVRPLDLTDYNNREFVVEDIDGRWLAFGLKQAANDKPEVENDMTEENDNKRVVARREDWGTKPMPEKHETFILNRSFSDEEMAALRHGNIPQEMEDKWFWYMEGSTLWAHRSWTGYCIYQIEFREDNNHLVTVNRDPEQYKCTGVEEDLESLNRLLDWWTQTPYDHYNEWIDETYINLQKAV